VGSNGTIIHTVNGGCTWYNQYSSQGMYLQSVYFTCLNKVFAVGKSGKILMTTNGGQNWFSNLCGISNNLYMISFTNRNYELNECPKMRSATIVGSGGIILHNSFINSSVNDNTGINSISNETPSQYSLMQNYPNPFNPSTNIKYQIKNNGLVNLKVTNELGSEVKNLVNEIQTKGTYEVTFN
jgi:photosystem II stability/assembly factor-like uncharacterized protein